MFDEKYFRDLKTLLEDNATQEQIEDNEEMPPQEEIQEPQEEEQEEETQESEDNYVPNETVPESLSGVIEKQKLTKYFNLFNDLLLYNDTFIENLKYLDIDLIDSEDFILLQRYTKNMKSVSEKIKKYLLEVFNNDDYKRIMYAYVLFSTEITTNIKGIRTALHLNDVEDENAKNEEK